MFEQIKEATQFFALFSPAGKQQLAEIIQNAKNEHGEAWQDVLKNDYPMFPYLFDLVATKTKEEAFEQLQSDYSDYPLEGFRQQIYDLHDFLILEFEKKRF